MFDASVEHNPFVATMQQHVRLLIFPDMFVFPFDCPGNNNVYGYYRKAESGNILSFYRSSNQQ